MGGHLSSEFEPFTGDPSAHSADVADFLALNRELGVLPTSFGEGGYLAANIMIAALESIEGEITFDAVQEAIRNLTYETPMLGRPFSASGYVDGSQPNQTSQILRVDGLDFVPVSDGWRNFPLDQAGGCGGCAAGRLTHGCTAAANHELPHLAWTGLLSDIVAPR
jgi:hypothetical protein